MKLASWNLCLGLKNKKDYVYETLNNENIDICLLQEVEIRTDYPLTLLSSKNYKIEVENSSQKARCAIAIKKTVNYTRREDLEGIDLSICVIDVNGTNNYRIVNFYRLFNPPNNLKQSQHLQEQLTKISGMFNDLGERKILIGGDFNLDDSKRYAPDYRYKHLFEFQNQQNETLNLIQIIDFPTWRRIVDNVQKESILDHVYVQDPTIVKNINSFVPTIGDHVMIIIDIVNRPEPPKIITKRSWISYSKIKLLNELSQVTFKDRTDDVQSTWNNFEAILMPIVDKLVPLVEFSNNSTIKSTKPTNTIKRKINLRKRLLKSIKDNPTNAQRDRIKSLNVEIRHHFQKIKTDSIRRKILPGDSKSLWDAVKVAKDINVQQIPSAMYRNGILIEPQNLPDEFASFFKDKVQNVVNNLVIDDNVYNGTRKINAENEDFMTENDVLIVMENLKTKNCEGHDRLPLRILADGTQFLIKPLSQLFNLIYTTKEIPEQWLISKIIPLHKKGPTKNLENYRPIANLCSCSKIFEKLVLNKIRNLESKNSIDITGKSQHGFKPNHSTLTAGLKIQSLISRAVDDDMYALMASLDLSAAFDVVNVELLLKRLHIVGLPHDLVDLVSKWLTNRVFYVSLDGNSSIVHECNVGTVQGSILGPILYSIFVSPLLDLTDITLFADDNYALVWNKCKEALKNSMQIKLEIIISWLAHSGLKVNEDKTELCLFHRKDQPQITIVINNTNLTSKNHMNVLGVAFDSKLNWQKHIQNAITKAKKNLHAIKLIRKHFTKKEILQLITSNYYSILYYNSEIWHIPSLSYQSKRYMLSASATPLKLCTKYDENVSFATLHNIHNRATPEKMIKYKMALQLHKIYNDDTMSFEWQQMFFVQNFNERNQIAKFIDLSRYKIGKNLITNRLNIINNKIPLNWLNLSHTTYKLKCKELFLRN